MAIRVAEVVASPRALAGPDSASCASCANPSGSRTSAMTGARCLWVRVSIQARSGRMISPQASIRSPEVRSTRSYDGDGPLSRKKRSGRSVQSAPGISSARLAFHRCCQVSPGRLDSQRRSLATPRRRPARVAFAAAKKGGVVSRRSTSSADCAVAGHHASAERGGKRSRSTLFRARACSTVAFAVCICRRVECFVVMVMKIARTARPRLRGRSRALEAAAPARRAGLPAGRGGPAPRPRPRPGAARGRSRS